MQVIDSQRTARLNREAPTDARPAASTAPRLKDRMQQQIRLEGKSRRTFQAYWHWTAAFIRWSGLRHPQDMGAADIQQFLNWLVNARRRRPPHIKHWRGLSAGSSADAYADAYFTAVKSASLPSQACPADRIGGA